MMNRRTVPNRLSPNNHSNPVQTTPVLFSLPDLSLTPRSNSNLQATTSPVPLAQIPPHTPSITTPPSNGPSLNNPIEYPKSPAASPTFSQRFLNTSIAVLLAALLLLAFQIYTDKKPKPDATDNTSTKNSIVPNTAQATHNAPATAPFSPASQQPSATPIPPYPNPNTPSSIHNGVAIESTTPSDKPSLEISDPVTTASFENTASPQPPLTPPLLANLPPNSLPTSPTTDNATSPPTLQALPPSANPNANAPRTISSANNLTPNAIPANAPSANTASIPAQSLNTRDMILLRQGKSIANSPTSERPAIAAPKDRKDSANQINSPTALNGSTYPPVKQKYEPISIPNLSPITSRPTSMEIPPPPKPYQPIGANFEDTP